MIFSLGWDLTPTQREKSSGQNAFSLEKCLKGLAVVTLDCLFHSNYPLVVSIYNYLISSSDSIYSNLGMLTLFDSPVK